ncbi:outer membrane beta-barrel protein [Burkholderiaceae bacterium DAT-1]|nr:outer membrane beta-barrel protein [Burkholderiaceae bacterium DAT-1]
MNKIIATLLFSAALITPAAASSLYVGGDGGQSSMDADAGDGYTLTKKDTSWSAFTGYRFDSNVAVEFGYRDYGKISGNGVSVSADAWQASVVGLVPLNRQVSLTGRIGGTSVTAKSNGRGFHDSETRNRGFVGFGVQYAVNPKVDLRAEYTRTGDIEGVTLSTLTVGAAYHF